MAAEIDLSRIPEHIAIIMDGNGRWAQKRGLPRVMGHKAGMEAVRRTVRYCSDMGIRILTVFAFSTENWKRPLDEVNYLMNLLAEYLKKEVHELHLNRVRIKVLGELEILPPQTKKEILEAIELTKDNRGLQFNIALNYGGRSEILRALKKLIKQIDEFGIDIDSIDEKMFSSCLYTRGDPDPDLIIRTSGEKRISNFLIWQGAYSEFIFTEQLWPDFGEKDLNSAILEYQSRDRRFGALNQRR